MDTSEERAFNLLRWVPFSLPVDFDESLGNRCYYTQLQAQRSDQALKSFEALHPYQPSDELSAFRELERLGVLSQLDFFSPSLSKNAFYTKRLKQHHSTISDRNPEPQNESVGDCERGAGEQLAAFNAQRRLTRRSRVRRQRC